MRLDALVRQHPAWPEVARLDRLARGLPAPVSGPRRATAPVRLLVWPANADMEPVEETVRRRREDARKQLEEALQEGLRGFAEGEAERLEIFLAGRRRELEAEERRALAEQSRSMREVADREAQTRLDRIADDLALLRASRDGLEGQLREDFLIRVTPETLQQELESLKGTTATLTNRNGVRGVQVELPTSQRGFSPRAYLTAARDAVARLIRQREGDIASQRATIDRKLADDIDTLRQEASRRVEMRVEQLREQRSVEVEPILERQEFEDLLERTLGSEGAPARVLEEIAPVSRTPIEPWRAPMGVSPDPRVRGDLMRTRDLLVRRLRADVADRVRDSAQARGMVVDFGNAPGTPDRTDDFSRWIWDRSEL